MLNISYKNRSQGVNLTCFSDLSEMIKNDIILAIKLLAVAMCKKHAHFPLEKLKTI